jgi:hypothetical protein
MRCTSLALLCLVAVPAVAQPVFETESPFRLGEGFGTPATCDTVEDWVDQVPDYDGRISMVIEGSIDEGQWDGALAYLIMCRDGPIQVMCVTYEERAASSEPVLFAGGYNRVGETQVMLDPCLVYPADEALTER